MRIIFLLVFNSIVMASTVVAQTNVLVVYHSETGNTEQMALAVAEGARTVDGINVTLISVDDAKVPDLLKADAIILGSPVHNANVSTEIQQFISSWPFQDEPLKNKIGAVFVTAGGISAGEEIVQMNIIQSMLVFGMIIVGGPDWRQPFGASAITSEQLFTTEPNHPISDHFFEKGRLLGERVAKITLKFKRRNNK